MHFCSAYRPSDFGNTKGDILPLLSMYAGLGAVLGHNFPFYMKFKGGKGIAAMAGLLAATTNIWICLIALAVFVTIVAATKYVSVGSIAVVIIFFAGVVIRGQIGDYGMEGAPLYEMYVVAGFLALMAIWKHRANIGRLLNGTENKISFGKKNRRHGMAKVGIMGAGSWGTAIAWLLTNNGNDVTVWSIDEKEVKELDREREHKSKLPGVKLQDSICFTNVMEEGVKDKDFVVLAVPSPFTRETARKMRPYVAEGQILVNVAKGIEETTLMTLSQQIEEEVPQADVAVLSGPSHAEEVGRGLPTTCVVGARTKRQQNICSRYS